MELDSPNLSHYWNFIVDMTVRYVPKFILALIVLWVGLMIIGSPKQNCHPS
jgi:hypothetical protein